MPSTTNEKDTLTICSYSLDLDPVFDMVNPSMGELESKLLVITLIMSLGMHPSQRIILPLDKDLAGKTGSRSNNNKQDASIKT